MYTSACSPDSILIPVALFKFHCFFIVMGIVIVYIINRLTHKFILRVGKVIISNDGIIRKMRRFLTLFLIAAVMVQKAAVKIYYKIDCFLYQS